VLLNIRVVPRAKKTLIKQEGTSLKIYVSAPAEDGRANKAVIKLLSEHFKIPKSKIKIIKGKKSREKIISVTGNQ